MLDYWSCEMYVLMLCVPICLHVYRTNSFFLLHSNGTVYSSNHVHSIQHTTIVQLLYDLCDHTCANCFVPFSESKPLVDLYWNITLHGQCQFSVISWHHHLLSWKHSAQYILQNIVLIMSHTCRQLHGSSNICSTCVQLRGIVVHKGCVSPSLFLLQDVDLQYRR